MSRFLLLLLALFMPGFAVAQVLTVTGGGQLRLENRGVVRLSGGASLEETGGGRVTGGTGTITATRRLLAPSAVNIAGLGATLTSSQSLGVTTVTRGHAVQPVSGATTGIARYYDITPTTNTGLDATLVFAYHDGELNGLMEADLALYRSTNGGTTWQSQGGTVDEANNTVTLTGLDGLSRWTAGPSVQQLLQLAATALLQGAYLDASSPPAMRTDLSNDLPETDPYGLGATVAPGFFTTNPAGQQVVDWVWIELRTGDPANPPMQVVAARAALLLADGSIVDTDGTSDVSFDGLAPGTYYLAAGHRNHLAVMSNQVLDCTSGTCSYDFTGGSAYGTNAQADLGGSGIGPWACFAGDGNASGGVTATDQALWLGENGTAGYLWGDYNLSGGATAADQALWLQNNGTSTQVPPGN